MPTWVTQTPADALAKRVARLSAKSGSISSAPMSHCKSLIWQKIDQYGTTGKYDQTRSKYLKGLAGRKLRILLAVLTGY